MTLPIYFPFVGDSVGGSHISTILLIQKLDRTSFEPRVVLHEEGALADYLSERHIAYRVLPLSYYAGAVPSPLAVARGAALALPTLGRFLHKNQPGIVHTNDLRMHLTWSPSASALRRRVITHQRVVQSRSPYWRVLAATASHIICISRFILEHLPPNGRKRATVIPNPVATKHALIDRAKAKQQLQNELGIEDGTVVIGYVGNMTQQKRPDVFVSAAALIARTFMGPTSYLIIGDDRGGQRKATADLAFQLGISGQCHFMGYRTPIEPIIAGCDMLIAPAINEGFGRSIAEAMMVGTPIVASRSGGHIEILEDGKLAPLATPDDAASFANAAVNLLNQPHQRRAFVDMSRRKATTELSTDAHLAAVCDIYETVVSGSTLGR